MNVERVERMRRAMERDGMDVLVCRLAENVLVLSGYWPICGWVYLVFPREGRAACIVPDTELSEAHSELWEAECLSHRFGTVDAGDQQEEIRRLLRGVSRDKRWRRIGYEGGFDSIAPAWNAAESQVPTRASERLLEESLGGGTLVDATGLLVLERSIKTPHEIEKIRAANEIAVIGLEAFFERAVVGRTAVQIAAEVESETTIRGTLSGRARRVRAFAQVAVGAGETSRAWRPAEITSTRTLEEGDIALLELAVVADGYWSDRTRPKVAGRPTERQSEIADAVARAQREAIRHAVPGAKASDVDAAARKVLRDAALEREFVHITGHATGFRYHELHPTIAPGSEDVLAEGMVHTVEPGVYSPAFGGIRIEDAVVVTGAGAQVLAPFTGSLA